MKATSRPTPISQRQLRCFFGGAAGGGAAGGGGAGCGCLYAVGGEPEGALGTGVPGASAERGGSSVTTSVRGAGWGTQVTRGQMVANRRRPRDAIQIAMITRQFPSDRSAVVRLAAKPDIAVCDTSGRQRLTLVLGGTQEEGESFADAKSTRDARPTAGTHFDPGRTSGNTATRGIHPVALTSSSDVCLRAGFDSCKPRHVSKSGCGPESELAVAAGRHRGRPRQVFGISRPAMSGANTKPSAPCLFFSRRQST